MEYDHTSDLHQDFLNLLENSEDFNVKFEIGKEPNIKEFEAHSLILSTRSTYFQKIFSKYWNWNEEKEVPVFKKPNISPLTFEILLKYIYTGTLSVDDEASFADIIVAADEFELQTLVQQLEKHLIQNESAWQLPKDFIKICQHKQFPNLGKYALDLACRNPKLIFESKNFLQMEQDILIQLLKCDDLELKEFEIWEHLIRWGIANTNSTTIDDDLTKWTPMDFNNLENILHNCIPHIRFFHMSPNDYAKVRGQFKSILPSGLDAEVIQYFLNLNANPSFNVLKPRVSDYPFDSKIVNAKDAALISSWIDDRQENPYLFNDLPYEFKLIYRASSEGFGVNNFHTNCDDKGPTVVVIKVRNSEEIIGGYNPLGWRSIKTENMRSYLLSFNNEFYTNHKCETSSSFLFSLTNRAKPILSKASSKDGAIMWSKRKGPCFSKDLCIYDGSSSESSYNNLFGTCEQCSYEKEVMNRKNFQLEDYEVFQIINKGCSANNDVGNLNYRNFRNYISKRWSSMDFINLEKTLRNCIPHIRFYQMLPDDYMRIKAQFKNIIPNSLDNEIIQYFLNPNSSQSFKGLPLRTSSYSFDSNIIHTKDAALIASWVDGKQENPYRIKDLKYEFKLIYRASREGFSVNEFHGNCDNKGPTVIVIKVRNSGEIIGGYNPLEWRSMNTDNERSPLLSSDYSLHKTTNSFIFSLTNRSIPILSRVSSKHEAILCGISRGPCFGLKDLCISNVPSREGTSHGSIVGTNLLENPNGFNVKVKVGDVPNVKEFRAHSIILCARTNNFYKAFSAHSARYEDGVITFMKPSISPLVFEIILKYIYTGLLTVDNNTSLVDIIIAADDFGLPKLFQQLETHLLHSASAWNFPKDLLTIRQHDRFPNLSEFALKSVSKFKNLIPDKFDDDIINYFLNPTPNHSFDALPLRTSAYVFNSKILNPRDAVVIANWIDKNQGRPLHIKDLNYEFKLIYRASREGFDVNNFHINCDNKGPTVIVIKVRNSGECIGGYNPLEWFSVDTDDERSHLLSPSFSLYSTTNSFIFSLTNRAIPILSRVSSEHEAIFCSNSKGPCFGLKDLCVTHSHKDIVGTSRQYSYEKKIINSETFEIEEYEVFQIFDKRSNS
ncbi:13432_t:CDS:2 [Funneliformis geosporum]|nr:13432_t:CDS:2 [Funneliformis geosporum]